MPSVKTLKAAADKAPPKLLPKPSKRLARLLDPKSYIQTEPYDKDFPDMGIRYICFAGDGKRLAHSQSAADAWKLSSIRLRNAVINKYAKKIGLL